MSFKQICVWLFAFAVFLLPSVSAQQSNSQQKKKPTPTLETDDVIPVTTKTEPPPVTKPAEKKEDGKPDGKTEEKKDDSTKSDKAGAQEDAKEEKKDDPAEQDWRQRIRAARETVKALRRQTQEAELQMTALRNTTSAVNNTPDSLNARSNALNANGQQIAALREQLAQASDQLNQLSQEGITNKYHEVSLKPTNDKGEPNEDYYKSRYADLLDDVNDAERRVRLQEYQINDLKTQLMATGGQKGKKGGGDNFAGLKIQSQIDQAQIELDLARADYMKARQAVEQLVEEARQAGLPAGIFRE
ncbi:MAG TPA: hypothetical protein VFC63_05425 [Blastocatellia bacterium]|nr:hypothetical protein [Blastocatellia bacterium]